MYLAQERSRKERIADLEIFTAFHPIVLPSRLFTLIVPTSIKYSTNRRFNHDRHRLNRQP